MIPFVFCLQHEQFITDYIDLMRNIKLNCVKLLASVLWVNQ